MLDRVDIYRDFEAVRAVSSARGTPYQDGKPILPWRRFRAAAGADFAKFASFVDEQERVWQVYLGAEGPDGFGPVCVAGPVGLFAAASATVTVSFLARHPERSLRALFARARRPDSARA